MRCDYSVEDSGRRKDGSTRHGRRCY
jgi:hypothetical protein